MQAREATPVTRRPRQITSLLRYGRVKGTPDLAGSLRLGGFYLVSAGLTAARQRSTRRVCSTSASICAISGSMPS
ncbi:hypothetical protein GCM10027615_33410 [Plantactinospora veratri]